MMSLLLPDLILSAAMNFYVLNEPVMGSSIEDMNLFSADLEIMFRIETF